MERTPLRGRVSIEGAEAHPHAARRLRESFPAIEWVEGGSSDRPSLKLATDGTLPEGAFSIESSTGDATSSVTVTGGPFSGTIYGAEEIIQRLAQPIDGGFDLPIGTIEDAPDLAYRTWWNWDHSTNWDLEQIGVQEIGVMNPYAKPADGFLSDFKRVVDFMSRNRIAAIAIYGFLRESHGGIEAAQELCRYATERGVRILPGIAINAYGGIVWEMEHEFNLATWLRKHPELAAQMERPPGFQIQDLGFYLYFPRGDYSMRGCPSQRPIRTGWPKVWPGSRKRSISAGSISKPVTMAFADARSARRAEPNGRTPAAATAMPNRGPMPIWPISTHGFTMRSGRSTRTHGSIPRSSGTT